MASPEFSYQPAEVILEEGMSKAPEYLGVPSRNHFVFLAYLLDGNPLEERITVCESEEFFITHFTKKGAVEIALDAKDLDDLMNTAKTLSGEQPKSISRAIDLLDQVLAASQILSLNLPLKGSLSLELGDSIEDKNIGPIEEIANANTTAEEVKDAVRDAMKCLSEKEKAVIEMRFGLDCNPHTLEEVGNYFGFTRERARQIELRALSKLRHPSRGNKLRDYLE